MPTPKISVIIPVYNGESYLRECVDSLLNMTFKSCEFIFINDGSIDKTLNILEYYAKKDSRIVIINQKNKGVSVARNNGLKIAKGMYIGFVDADDWVEKDMYQILHDEMESSKCDLLLCNSKSEFDGKEHVSAYNFPKDKILGLNYIKNELLPYLIQYDDLYSLWNKLYKSSLISENHITFPEGNALSEDNIFNMLYFNKINTFKYINYTGYNYRDVDGSATRNILEMDYFKNFLNIFKFNYNAYMDLVQTDEEIDKLKSEKFIKNVLSLINVYFKPSNNLSFIRRYRYIRSMINNADVKNTVNTYFDYLYQKEGKFGKFMLTSLKQKSILKLFLASKYSIIRNNS
jgi:glycosyltransferase involved in cell wall biosynthesis